MKPVPADEVVYHDFTDENCLDLCMIKFKTTTDRVPLYVSAHKAVFKDAVWETETTAMTTMMKAEVDGKALTVKFCGSTGVIAAQGPQGASHWKNVYLQDLKDEVNSLQALQNQSSFKIDDTTVSEPQSHSLTNQQSYDEIAQVRDSFTTVVSDSSARIAAARRRDARTRNMAASFQGEVLWPNSTEEGPMKLSVSLPILHRSTQTEVLTVAHTEAPLMTSTPIGVRHLLRDPFVPCTPSLPTLNETDYTIQERNLTHDMASSPDATSSVHSEGTAITMERNLTHEPVVTSETYTSEQTNPSPPEQAFRNPDVRFPPPYSTVVERDQATSDKLKELSGMILDLQVQLNDRDMAYAEQMRLVTTLLKTQADLHRPSEKPTKGVEFVDKHLFIVSSLVQLIDEDQLVNTKVICKRGAHPSRLTRVLKAKKRAGERYASITLLVGGNRLKRSDPLSNVTQTAEEVMVTAQAAKAIADHVRVVELTPRLTSDSMLAAIQQLNAEVENKCPENGIEFAKTSGHFWLTNGKPNRALIEQQDKIHLTSLGSEILLECLGFKLNNPSDPRKGVKPKDIRPTLPPKQSANRENAAPATSKSPKSKGPGNSKDRKPSQAPRNQVQFRQNTPPGYGS